MVEPVVVAQVSTTMLEVEMADVLKERKVVHSLQLAVAVELNLHLVLVELHGLVYLLEVMLVLALLEETVDYGILLQVEAAVAAISAAAAAEMMVVVLVRTLVAAAAVDQV